MSKWSKSLPEVHKRVDPREYAEDALDSLVVALSDERHDDGEDLLEDVRYTAALLRAWRKSLGKDEHPSTYQPNYNLCDRDTIRYVMRMVLGADGTNLPAPYLRNAEFALRDLGKRLMKEADEVVTVEITEYAEPESEWVEKDSDLRSHHLVREVGEYTLHIYQGPYGGWRWYITDGDHSIVSKAGNGEGYAIEGNARAAAQSALSHLQVNDWKTQMINSLKADAEAPKAEYVKAQAPLETEWFYNSLAALRR